MAHRRPGLARPLPLVAVAALGHWRQSLRHARPHPRPGRPVYPRLHRPSVARYPLRREPRPQGCHAARQLRRALGVGQAGVYVRVLPGIPVALADPFFRLALSRAAAFVAANHRLVVAVATRYQHRGIPWPVPPCASCAPAWPTISSVHKDRRGAHTQALWGLPPHM